MTDVRLTFGFLNFKFYLLNVKTNCLQWVLELSESMELTTGISKGLRSKPETLKKNCEKHWDVFRLAYLSVEIQKRFGMITGRIVI